MLVDEAYKILEVNKEVSSEELKKKYKELSKKYHPDLYQNNPLANLAEEKFKEINEAYECLKDYLEREKNGEVIAANFPDGITTAFYRNTKLPFTGEYIFNTSLGGTDRGYFVNGLSEGIWTKYHENGDKFFDRNFCKGIVDGELRDYNSNQVYQVTNYKNGERHGKRYSYITKIENNFDNIQVSVTNKYSVEGQYYRGKAVGEWRYYNNMTCELSEVIQYPDYTNIKEIIFENIYYNEGIVEGKAKIFYKDNSLEMVNYEHGVLQDKATLILSNGDIEEYEYRQGVIKGNGKGKYSDREEECRYKYGKKEGEATCTFYNGAKIIYNYKNGILNGDFTFYTIEGNREVGTYKDGKLEGCATLYYKNGDKEEYKYINGEKNGKSTYFYKNNNKEEYTYINGKKEGKAIYYYKNGDKEEYNYDNGIKKGSAIYYYNNGNREEYTYVEGKKDSKIIIYDKEGNILTEDIIIDGKLKSELLEIIDRNKIEEIISYYDKELSPGLFNFKTADLEIDKENIKILNNIFSSYKTLKENGYTDDSLDTKLEKLKEIFNEKKKRLEKRLDDIVSQIDTAKKDINEQDKYLLVGIIIFGVIGFFAKGIFTAIIGLIIGAIYVPFKLSRNKKELKEEINELSFEKDEIKRIINKYNVIINV